MLVGELGEEALLRELRGLFAATGPDVATGIGDDAAVIEIPSGMQSVWSTDMLLEGVHFEQSWQTPWQLGRKCLAVNLSDIASMAAIPRYALLSLACPADTPLEFIIEFCHGFASLAAECGVSVIGGDTTGSVGGIIVSASAGGLVVKDKAILRSGAEVGDAIMVTGHLGDAAAGLRLLQMQKVGSYAEYSQLINAFLEPLPRMVAARAIGEAGATAMTDISDGLASDLRHICEESGTGAMLEPRSLPVSSQLQAATSRFDWNQEELLLAGGEDYELLFTLPGGIARQLKDVISKAAGIPVTVIGEIMPAGYGVRLVEKNGAGRPLPSHGYEHFHGET